MPTIGVTLGDQAGIGPEVMQKAITLFRQSNPRIDVITIGEVIDCELGKPSLTTAKAAYDALLESTKLIRSRKINAVVTGPVSKEWMHKVGFDYPGQTEFFAEQLDCDNHAMCLTGPSLTVALVTIHVAISEVPRLLKQSEIVRIGLLLSDFLRRKGIEKPRIAVCGLNPHAGENGAFGREEIEIISHAIAELNQADKSIYSGPHSADTVFYYAKNGTYDGVLCMYHDQGLIPLKLLDFDHGVNVTLGLPAPRTSPDHGTAFDIAGKGIAKADSALEALKLAAQLIS